MRKKIKSAKDLGRLRNAIIETRTPKEFSITISSGACGEARGSLKIIETLKKEIEARGLKDKVSLKVTGCHGFCEVEPIIIVRREENKYGVLYPTLEA